MNREDMVSVVVPVYNVGKYISRCIESLLTQTYENLEIILVDDGSSDESGSICDRYREQDQRIAVIHKENGGLSDARNVGIRYAKGRWITFIDSDDFVHPDYVRVLYQNIRENDADISICRHVSTQADVAKAHMSRVTEVYSRNEGIEKLLYQYISTSAWAKMYKTELFQDTIFPYGKLYEDVVTVFEVFSKANRIVLTNSSLYYYYVRENGIIRTSFTERKLDYIKNTNYILETVRKEFPTLERAAISRVLWADMHIVVQIGSDKRYLQIQSELWQEIRKNRIKVLLDRKCRWQNRVVLLLSFLGKSAICGVYHFHKMKK